MKVRIRQTASLEYSRRNRVWYFDIGKTWIESCALETSVEDMKGDVRADIIALVNLYGIGVLLNADEESIEIR